jgi:hypothetical protein
MMKIKNILKSLPRVVALLAMLTATFAVAQESPQRIGSARAGVSGAAGGAASRWGVHASPTGGASAWEVTRNTSSSSRFVPGGAEAHPSASVQDHPVSAGAVSSKREAHPSSKGLGAGRSVASSGAATGGTFHSPFSGGPHVTASHRSSGRKAQANLIAQQLKGNSTASRHHGGGRGQPAKSNKDSEPAAPKGEQNCDMSSKLELCTWL